MTNSLHPVTSNTLNALASDFLQQQLPAEAWTHHAHVCVACWHLANFPFWDAFCRIKAGIILLNQAHGTPNTQSRGYHETLTYFWMSVVNCWLQAHPGIAPADALNLFFDSPLASSSLPKHFYLDTELADPASRGVWLPPTQMAMTDKNLFSIA